MSRLMVRARPSQHGDIVEWSAHLTDTQAIQVRVLVSPHGKI